MKILDLSMFDNLSSKDLTAEQLKMSLAESGTYLRDLVVSSTKIFRGHHIFLGGWLTQPTKVKVVGTFHVPSTWNPCKSLTANGTAERACYFCRLCPDTTHESVVSPCFSAPRSPACCFSEVVIG